MFRSDSILQKNSESPISSNFNILSRHLKDEFIYHSSGIEGNSLTLEQTSQILNCRKVNLQDVELEDVVETRNHGKAFNELLDSFIEKEIDLETIQTLHSLLMSTLLPNQNNQNVGLFRRHNVAVGTEKTLFADAHEVKGLMDRFVRYINSDMFVKSHPAAQACLIHYNFVEIHPFVDGNGRLVRLLMNLVLLKHKIPLTIITKEERSHYFHVIKQHFETSTTQKSQFRSPLCDYIAEKVNIALKRVAR